MAGGVTLLVNLGTKKASYATIQLGVIFPDNGSGSIDNEKSYENVAFLNKNHPIILWCVYPEVLMALYLFCGIWLSRLGGNYQKPHFSF